MSSPSDNKLVFSGTSSTSLGARSATSILGQNEATDQKTQSPTPKMERGGDHLVSHSNRLSFKSYPEDCPPLTVRWYHAVDVSSDQLADTKLD